MHDICRSLLQDLQSGCSMLPLILFGMKLSLICVKKIVYYGLDLFFDAAVGEKLRDQYSSEEHLSGIKDKTLLDTCRKLELINDLVYTKLSHILTMRNDIGSSHPNTYSINSYELLGWLQTCIQEVIQVIPSAAAMTVKAIVDNLKKETSTIRQDVVDRFNGAIVELSTSMTANLLVTLFGLFTTEQTSKIIRENILLFVPVLWHHSNDNVKYDLGEKVDVFKLNLDSTRTELAERFFEICDGYRYLSLSTRSIRISSLCDDLYNAHNGWDNFYHEVPVIREIMQYIRNSEDIPDERQDKLIETILICRTGNGVSYLDGVSPGARQYFGAFFTLLNPNQIIRLIALLEEQRIKNHITGRIVCSHFRDVLLKIRTSLNSARVNEVIDFLIQNHTNLYNIVNTRQYKDLTRNIF